MVSNRLFFIWIFLCQYCVVYLLYSIIFHMSKKRTDRNHIIYEIVNTVNGKRYIGLTVARGRAYKKSVLIRFHQHCMRALTENKDWALYNDMRKYQHDVYDVSIVDIVRGKAEAHRIETDLIHNYEYKLNSTIKK